MRIGVNEICFKKCIRNRKYALLEQFACMKSVFLFRRGRAWAFGTLFWKRKFLRNISFIKLVRKGADIRVWV